MTPRHDFRMCCITAVCYYRTHSQSGHSAQRKCLFSLTNLNAIWLGGANSVVLIQEMISPEDMEKAGCFFHAALPLYPLLQMQGRLTTTVTNWPWCDGLYIEGTAPLPTKTHTPLDVTGLHLAHAKTFSVVIQLRAIMVFTRSCSLLEGMF